MTGIFSNKDPKDLFHKLCGDLERLRENNKDEGAAMDFFVTAESLTDWRFPGRRNKEKQKEYRSSSVLLMIVSHLASGAKHFEVEAKHHTSVSNSKRTGGHFASGHFASNYFASGYFPKGNLIIELEGKAKEELGQRITAILLAELVAKFWEQELQQL